MIVLGIETATAVCSVGLVDGARTFGRTIREDRVHSEKLLSLVDDVLREASLSIRQVAGVAVSSGPGSFTGLRIGASAAKGLVSAAGSALVAVPTLSACVRGARAAGRLPVGGWLAVDARQGEWYAAECDAQGQLGDVAIMAEADLRERCAGREVISDRPSVFVEASVATDLLEHLDGRIVATMGRERLERGVRDDVAAFEPKYLKAFEVRNPATRLR